MTTNSPEDLPEVPQDDCQQPAPTCDVNITEIEITNIEIEQSQAEQLENATKKRREIPVWLVSLIIVVALACVAAVFVNRLHPSPGLMSLAIAVLAAVVAFPGVEKRLEPPWKKMAVIAIMLALAAAEISTITKADKKHDEEYAKQIEMLGNQGEMLQTATNIVKSLYTTVNEEKRAREEAERARKLATENALRSGGRESLKGEGLELSRDILEFAAEELRDMPSPRPGPEARTLDGQMGYFQKLMQWKLETMSRFGTKFNKTLIPTYLDKAKATGVDVSDLRTICNGEGGGPDPNRMVDCGSGIGQLAQRLPQ